MAAPTYAIYRERLGQAQILSIPTVRQGLVESSVSPLVARELNVRAAEGYGRLCSQHSGSDSRLNSETMSRHAFCEYNLVKTDPHTSPKSGNGREPALIGRRRCPLGSLMSGVRKEQLDQATHQPPREPFDFAQGRLHYLRRRRNRSYLVVSALIIAGVGMGVAAVLLADWLSPLAR